jgi:hypothetical protein
MNQVSISSLYEAHMRSSGFDMWVGACLAAFGLVSVLAFRRPTPYPEFLGGKPETIWRLSLLWFLAGIYVDVRVNELSLTVVALVRLITYPVLMTLLRKWSEFCVHAAERLGRTPLPPVFVEWYVYFPMQSRLSQEQVVKLITYIKACAAEEVRNRITFGIKEEHTPRNPHDPTGQCYRENIYVVVNSPENVFAHVRTREHELVQLCRPRMNQILVRKTTDLDRLKDESRFRLVG